MTANSVLSLMQEALWLSLLLPAPVLVVGLGIGLLISIVQAVTQIHEQSLVFIPKLVATALVLLVMGHWMLRLLVDFTRRVLLTIPSIVN